MNARKIEEVTRLLSDFALSSTEQNVSTLSALVERLGGDAARTVLVGVYGKPESK